MKAGGRLCHLFAIRTLGGFAKDDNRIKLCRLPRSVLVVHQRSIRLFEAVFHAARSTYRITSPMNVFLPCHANEAIEPNTIIHQRLSWVLICTQINAS
jgi:hypothetical protein